VEKRKKILRRHTNPLSLGGKKNWEKDLTNDWWVCIIIVEVSEERDWPFPNNLNENDYEYSEKT
jgi:hypothetical protein